MSEAETPGAVVSGARQLSWVFTPLKVIAGSAIFGMSVLTFVDVLGRYLFASPIPGTFELVGLLLGVVVMAGLPMVSFNQSHITVDLFDTYFHGGMRRLRTFLVLLGSAAMVAFIGHRLLMAGLDEAANDFVTENLGISRAPLIYLMAGFAFLTCALLLIMCWQHAHGRLDAGKTSVELDET